jgi:glucose/mannose-6-phosphate isomerase
LPSAADVDNIVTLGMGGSGIAGNVLQAMGTASLPVPVTVLKHYRTPAFVGPRTLGADVVLGRHRETIEMAQARAAGGASSIPSGGELGLLRSRVRCSSPPD